MEQKAGETRNAEPKTRSQLGHVEKAKGSKTYEPMHDCKKPRDYVERG